MSPDSSRNWHLEMGISQIFGIYPTNITMSNCDVSGTVNNETKETEELMFTMQDTHKRP